MLAALNGLEPLSQVVFIHDYIQLRFQDQIVSILNVPELHMPDGRVLNRDSPGFCDALVALIGLELADSTLDEGKACSLVFDNSVKLVVPLTDRAARGPEALELPRLTIIFNA